MKHFKKSEFDCKCGKCGMGYKDMKPDLLRKLQKARAIAGTPFNIVSPMRCPEYNAKVGGKKSSAHLKGYAVDINTPGSVQRFKILRGLILAGFNRIGVYRTFIHADTDPSLPAQVTWYGK